MTALATLVTVQTDFGIWIVHTSRRASWVAWRKPSYRSCLTIPTVIGEVVCKTVATATRLTVIGNKVTRWATFGRTTTNLISRTLVCCAVTYLAAVGAILNELQRTRCLTTSTPISVVAYELTHSATQQSIAIDRSIASVTFACGGTVSLINTATYLAVGIPEYSSATSDTAFCSTGKETKRAANCHIRGKHNSVTHSIWKQASWILLNWQDSTDRNAKHSKSYDTVAVPRTLFGCYVVTLSFRAAYWKDIR